MNYAKTQFDKVLLSCLFVGTVILAHYASDRVFPYACTWASGFFGGLMLLITGRRSVDPPLFPDPTSSITKASSTVETVTKTETPAPKLPLTAHGEPSSVEPPKPQ